MKKFLKVLSVWLAVLFAFSFPIALAKENDSIKIDAPSAVLDGRVTTRKTLSGEISISADSEIKCVYIVFWDKFVPFEITANGSNIKCESEMLHCSINTENLKSKILTLKFLSDANVSDIYAFCGETPDFVQTWKSNDQNADMLIFSTHADDEQLFFAGVLPLYANNRDVELQVIYFTDHNRNIVRRHELLNGLWIVGVRRYPVISNLPDAYSESVEAALSNLNKSGFTRDDALSFQVEQIRKYKPFVILGHDLKGEYGHGQHMLNALLLTESYTLANDMSAFPESAKKYGTWQTKKLYLHSYAENRVELDLDTPIESLGMSPFELSQKGFLEHSTQQDTWFRTWLNGKNGEITKASQIKSYSPCIWGLYKSEVGVDTLKNDLLENITVRSKTVVETPPQAPSKPQQNKPQKDTKLEEKSILRYILIPLITVVLIFILIAAFKKGRHNK